MNVHKRLAGMDTAAVQAKGMGEDDMDVELKRCR